MIRITETIKQLLESIREEETLAFPINVKN